MDVDDDDRGHRHGNFPNYYSFHPANSRIEVLEQCHMLRYIRAGLLGEEAADASVEGGGGRGDGAEESAKKRPRKESKPIKSQGRAVHYCDLGCNEGDLTMAMARSLIDAPSCGVGEASSSCDNESAGELSTEGEPRLSIRCLGLDIDPTLVGRAAARHSRAAPHSDEGSESGRSSRSANHNVDATFRVCNLCSRSEHDEACASFSGRFGGEGDGATTSDPRHRPERTFHLTTVFSTTMWIHVHGGDDGLREFLERACRWTRRFLLIEPQPSGCYRKANVRLRKMGRPELDDVTSSRLEMRPDVEGEIEDAVVRCGFRRVTTSEMGGEEDDAADKGRGGVTSWNRTMRLYERTE